MSDWELTVRSSNSKPGGSRLSLALSSAPKSGCFSFLLAAAEPLAYLYKLKKNASTWEGGHKNHPGMGGFRKCTVLILTQSWLWLTMTRTKAFAAVLLLAALVVMLSIAIEDVQPARLSYPMSWP